MTKSTTSNTTPVSILLVEDEGIVAEDTRRQLKRVGYTVGVCGDADEALAQFVKEGEPLPDVVLMDINLPGETDGIDAAKIITERYKRPVIFLTGLERDDYCQRALEAKPFAYYVKPIKVEQLRMSIDAAAGLAGERRAGDGSIPPPATDKAPAGLGRRLTGCSPAIRKTRGEIAVLGPSTLSVVIMGETGTGKEIIARELHGASSRSAKPYIPLNCATLGILSGSELFGHAQGAFTGAVRGTNGHVGAADGGTLFLDEVEVLPLDAQAQLLRFLDSGEYCRVGDSQMRRADVRILSASNKDLDELCAAGVLRRDLFYRLAGGIIRTVPLRERREDIPVLVRHFLATFAKEERHVCRIGDNVLAKMCVYDWPGNVRQLKQAVSLLCERHTGAEVALADLKDICAVQPSDEHEELRPYQETKTQLLLEFETQYFSKILARSKGSLGKALELSGMHKKNFYQKLKAIGLPTRNFK